MNDLTKKAQIKYEQNIAQAAPVDLKLEYEIIIIGLGSMGKRRIR